MDALNKLCRWRLLLVGKLLGTRTSDDAQAQALRDVLNTLLCLRAEVSAITALLEKKKVFTAEEFDRQLGMEAQHYDRAYEKQFPGFRTSESGVVCFDPQKGAETTKGWPA
jgi:hypothetical protein